MEEGGKEKGRNGVQRRSEGMGSEELRERGRKVGELEEGGKEKVERKCNGEVRGGGGKEKGEGKGGKGNGRRR